MRRSQAHHASFAPVIPGNGLPIVHIALLLAPPAPVALGHFVVWFEGELSSPYLFRIRLKVLGPSQSIRRFHLFLLLRPNLSVLPE